MWKFFVVASALCSIVYAAAPHHSLAESPDKDVQRFGELIDELVKIFEKVTTRKESDKSLLVQPNADGAKGTEPKGLLSHGQVLTHSHVFNHIRSTEKTTTRQPIDPDIQPVPEQVLGQAPVFLLVPPPTNPPSVTVNIPSPVPTSPVPASPANPESNHAVELLKPHSHFHH